MEKENIFEEFGLSKHREKGALFNSIDIAPDYVNCFFSSAKTIALIRENLDEHDRFFLADATFKITPNGPFKQVLILHVQFGIRVNSISSLVYIFLLNFFFQ